MYGGRCLGWWGFMVLLQFCFEKIDMCVLFMCGGIVEFVEMS